jgi:hypothetical protein
LVDEHDIFYSISVPRCATKFHIVATSLIYSGLADVVTSMHKTQHDMIIFLLFVMLFLGLTYFPIKQVSADKVDTGKIPQLPPEVQPPTPQADLAPPTSNQQRLQVSFTSIKINNDHDPQIKYFYQNDGEWKIGTLVNGQFRNLSPPGSPLGDARGGRTYSLSNIQPVVLNVDKSSGALIISTIGQELDGCNFNFKIPSSVMNVTGQVGKALASYYTGGKSTAACNAAGGRCEQLRAATYNYQLKVAQAAINKVCNTINKNDAIGTISDTYGPSTFGVGQHSTLSTPVSDSGRDFVLTYQIKPVQQPLQSQVQQQSSQFQQPSNPNVRDHRTTPSSLP